MHLKQTPATFSKTLLHSGDLLEITLELDRILPGKAFVRTNLGNNAVRLREIIEQVDLGRPPAGRDWRDIEMRQVTAQRYSLLLPMNEVGVFEFKAFFREESSQQTHWPRGENALVKIEAAVTFADNSIYNAFVRQFGANKFAEELSAEQQKAESLLNSQLFTVIPPSGKFQDLAAELDFIMGELGFRIIQLLPIHPVPGNYARMGRYGSPFAALDLYSVEPALAEFDRKSTPMEQFIQLVDEIHAREGMILLDIPAGHTGWGSVFQVHHPQWFKRREDGSFVNPGAWGVIWEDLCKLDYDKQELWQEMAQVFLHWCALGVDGFRCDAGYMIPAPVWTYIIAKVREQYPDCIFFLEGLGGSLESTEKLLSVSNMNWAYSEMFQQYSIREIKDYLDFACRFSKQNGPLVNFAETHDNDRLAKRSKTWARLRCNMNALLAPAGAFAIANGVEWLCTAKIDVHEARTLNWGAKDNLVREIQQLNHILKTQPAFQADAELRRPLSAEGEAIALLRIPKDIEQSLLVVVNPDEKRSCSLEWNCVEFRLQRNRAWDLLAERWIELSRSGAKYSFELPPATTYCLAKDKPAKNLPSGPSANQWQIMRDIVLDTFTFLHGCSDCCDLDMPAMLRKLYHNPVEFLRAMRGPKVYLPVIFWQAHRDENRILPLPPDHHLLVSNETPFVVKISLHGNCLQKQRAIPLADGSYCALMQPMPVKSQTQLVDLEINLFNKGQACRRYGTLAMLAKKPLQISLSLPTDQLEPVHCGLASNDLGGYAMPRAAWGQLHSKYDALLAANLDPRVPVSPRIMLTRCRAWLVHRDYSRELNPSCQDDFSVLDAQSMQWSFTVPSGMGENIGLKVCLQMSRHDNALRLSFTRNQNTAENQGQELDDEEPVTLILRPDIDDRSAHSVTTAFRGAETRFPLAVRNFPQAFEFAPEKTHLLRMSCSAGSYSSSPEWAYQIAHQIEAQRGLEPTADLFSPGYFRVELKGGESVQFNVVAELTGTKAKTIQWPEPPARAEKRELLHILRDSLQSYVVRRNEHHSIIAGYPWFLDWGRDSLIAMRGLIAAGLLEESAGCIRQYASLEKDGTLPNTLAGHEVANRDTSDAPLWLFVAVSDYLKTGTQKDFLQMQCQNRTLLEVLISIAENYLAGSANGIKACPESALVFSPAHYTWMDTNYPAATPRQGYPIEIQALWIHALQFLAKHDGQKKWSELASKARQSLYQYYPGARHVGFSDCLHAEPGQPASKAKPDDHCRPNQLLAVTLGVLDNHKLERQILRATQALLMPGGIRSLADQPVQHLLPVQWQGRLVNDPSRPYWGQYLGDEDSRRKPAYHNGTAWGWMLPSYCEALYISFGKSAMLAVKALHNLSADTLLKGCLGHLPEILDGDSPHQIRGCPAQAWSVTELYRVLKLLEKHKN
ncbi:MAG: glycogen debranching protein [Oligosphaeraceae bacterium]|nr:glycogen debranching protein [Oligosphaeraceae bacterium]